MPVCFELYKKGAKESSVLQEVDNDMRKHFNAPPSDSEWYKSWYSTIGLTLALGKNWTEVREIWKNKTEVIDWLEENYTTSSWWEGKH